MTLKLPALLKRLLEYRYWRRRGHCRRSAWWLSKRTL